MFDWRYTRIFQGLEWGSPFDGTIRRFGHSNVSGFYPLLTTEEGWLLKGAPAGWYDPKVSRTWSIHPERPVVPLYTAQQLGLESNPNKIVSTEAGLFPPPTVLHDSDPIKLLPDHWVSVGMQHVQELRESEINVGSAFHERTLNRRTVGFGVLYMPFLPVHTWRDRLIEVLLAADRTGVPGLLYRTTKPVLIALALILFGVHAERNAFDWQPLFVNVAFCYAGFRFLGGVRGIRNIAVEWFWGTTAVRLPRTETREDSTP